MENYVLTVLVYSEDYVYSNVFVGTYEKVYDKMQELIRFEEIQGYTVREKLTNYVVIEKGNDTIEYTIENVESCRI